MKKTASYISMGNGRFFLIFLIIILNFFILNTLLYSQSYQVRAYTEDDGLASPEVFDITQDFSGRIWFATRNGVTVYDGSNWKTYGTARGLPPGVYQEIKCDGKGTIWAFSTFSSIIIAKYDRKGDRWELLPAPVRQYEDRVNSFETAVINDETVLAVGMKGLGLYLWTGNSWKVFNSQKD